MPERVDADAADTVNFANAGERSHEVTRLDRPTCSGGEHETRISPGLAEPSPVSVLGFTAGRKGAFGELEQWQVPATRAGLNQADAQFALDALHLLTDMECVAIDICPAQAEKFASAHAV